jgi:hypothetical protein
MRVDDGIVAGMITVGYAERYADKISASSRMHTGHG